MSSWKRDKPSSLRPPCLKASYILTSPGAGLVPQPQEWISRNLSPCCFVSSSSVCASRERMTSAVFLQALPFHTVSTRVPRLLAEVLGLQWKERRRKRTFLRHFVCTALIIMKFFPIARQNLLSFEHVIPILTLRSNRKHTSALSRVTSFPISEDCCYSSSPSKEYFSKFL